MLKIKVSRNETTIETPLILVFILVLTNRPRRSAAITRTIASHEIKLNIIDDWLSQLPKV
jgi:hypothetical protein